MNVVQHVYSWQFNGRQWAAARLYQLWHPRGRAKVYERDPIPEPRRVLFIMTGLIGDSVMCTPVFIEARRIWPHAQMILLGRKATCTLLEACPLLDSTYETSINPFSLKRRREPAVLKQWLKEQRFDLAIILLGNHYAALLAEAEIPVRVGGSSCILTPYLTHVYNDATPNTCGPSERLNALRCLGYQVSEPLPKIWIADKTRQSARNCLMRLGLHEDDSYVAVHPYANTPERWWPVDRVAALASEVRRRFGLRTVLLGGSEGLGRIPKSVLKEVIYFSGHTPISEASAVIESSVLVVSTDSAPFHIAGSLGRPVVGLFRARRPEHARRYSTGVAIIGEDARCLKGRCQWHRCRPWPCREMASISTQQILEVLEHIMAGRKENER